MGLTTDSVALASGPICCGEATALCAGAAGGRFHRAAITAASAATALLAAGSWTSAAVPAGGGANLLECLEEQRLKVGASLTDPQYCVAAASWQPDGYTGGCDSTSTGFAFFCKHEWRHCVG